MHRSRIIIAAVVQRKRLVNVEAVNSLTSFLISTPLSRRFHIPTKFGQNKPEAYRGFRQEVLDCIVAARETIGDFDTQTGTGNASKQKGLVKVKKEVVSEIQKVLDPRKTEEKLFK